MKLSCPAAAAAAAAYIDVVVDLGYNSAMVWGGLLLRCYKVCVLLCSCLLRVILGPHVTASTNLHMHAHRFPFPRCCDTYSRTMSLTYASLSSNVLETRSGIQLHKRICCEGNANPADNRYIITQKCNLDDVMTTHFVHYLIFSLLKHKLDA